MRILVLTIFLLLSLNAKGDTLFKDRVALAIGHGTDDGKVIHWTDCDGGHPRTYKKPPHWVDRGGNCDLRPSDFGLKGTPAGGFVVEDEHTTQKYLPGVKQGQNVSFQNTETHVTLSSEGETITLRTRSSSSAGSTGQRPPK